MIKVEHLKKYYKDIKAVDDISFSVEQGELFGFLGVNGAGKSTTINMLCTLLKPTDGKIWINGLDSDKEQDAIKRQIGVVYQNHTLDKLLTVEENLMIRGSLFEKDKYVVKKNFERVSEMLLLTDVRKRPYGKLSGGQMRRSEIACALMHAPEILFLDEPTTGLDPATRKNVWSILETLQKDMKMTIFLTTHYMEEAARAKHIGIMKQGKLIQFGTPFSLKEEFAKDRLQLSVQAEQQTELINILTNQHLQYKCHENRIVVVIGSTLAALPILESVKHLITGFEVQQGSMDDVFLNTIKENELIRKNEPAQLYSQIIRKVCE